MPRIVSQNFMNEIKNEVFADILKQNNVRVALKKYFQALFQPSRLQRRLANLPPKQY